MPANLTPEYRAAEAKFRRAKTLEEKRAALQEMLATIPKHKGTEKIQADIKKRLARLRQEAGRKQGGPRTHTIFVEPSGVAQVVLLGPPNSGKSTLLAAVTRAHPQVAPYPFTTTKPCPGMLAWENVEIQLVDLPPISPQHTEGWLLNVAQAADGALLVADLTSPEVLEEVSYVVDYLSEHRIRLVPKLDWSGDYGEIQLPAMVVAAKADLASEEDAAALADLLPYGMEVIPFAPGKKGFPEHLAGKLWHLLNLVRVYTKRPGHQPDFDSPFVLPAGSTVSDLAAEIHGELAERLKFAWLWRDGPNPRRVGREFELKDGDVVELVT